MISNKEVRSLLSMKPGDSVSVNKSLMCSFTSRDELAFGKFEKDPASPSYTAVADIDVSGAGAGKMYLTCHNDMDNAYSCVIIHGGVMTTAVKIEPIN